MTISTKQSIWCCTEVSLNTSILKDSCNEYLIILIHTKNLLEKLPLFTATITSPINTVGAQAYLTFLISFLQTLKKQILKHNIEHHTFEFKDLNLKSNYDFYTLHRDYLTCHGLFTDLIEALRVMLKKSSTHANVITSIIDRIKKDFRENFEEIIAQNSEFSLFLYYYLFREDLEGVDLSSTDFTNINFDHARLAGANLTGSNLRNANLSSANLNDASLENAVLEGANLHLSNAERSNMTSANLKNTVFLGTNLSYSNIESADLSCANFQNTTMEGVNLSKAKIEYVNFDSSNLTNCIFDGASIQGCDFENANMTDAKLNEATFDKINLKGAILQRTNFQGKRFCGMDFSGMNLQAAVLSDCNLEGANLENADMRGVFLVNTNLSKVGFCGTNLYNADLYNAQLQDADLYFAILTSAKRLSVDTLKNAKNWDKAFYDVLFEEQIGLKGAKRFVRDDLKLIEKVTSIKDVKKEYTEYLKQRIDWDKK